MPNKKLIHLSVFFISSFILLVFFNNCGNYQANTLNDENMLTETGASSTPVTNDIGSKYSGTLSSNLQIVSKLGSVWGYALDPKNPSYSLKVIFYVDGVAGVGQYAGETQANQTAVGINAGHYFSFQLPAKFADGKYHKLYAYAVEAKASNLISPGAFNYEAYTQKAESVYNMNLKGFVSGSCSSCHGWSYSALFTGPLLNPSPLAGGTATNNLFIKKMMGHAGGKFCNSENEGICSEIQNWWKAEFN